MIKLFFMATPKKPPLFTRGRKYNLTTLTAYDHHHDGYNSGSKFYSVDDGLSNRLTRLASGFFRGLITTTYEDQLIQI